ncbi:MAG TPA: NERD domain-containing protein [Methylococcus sp.]|nr:NERD domain-containing protein [Methylococcus sp.]
MRLIPSTVVGDPKSEAERMVFDLLRQVTLPGGVAFHSLSISEHEYKRWGELDFVVLSPRGLIALEVKGGAVACHDGLWTYTDRFGNPHSNSEGPFRQVQSGLMGLRKRLEERVGGRLASLPFGYGVVLPQTPFNVVSVEWPPESVIDQPRLRNATDFERWVLKLFDYWRLHLRIKQDAPVELVREVQDLLRPEFERVPSLAYRVDSLVTQMDRLTDDQYRQLDLIEANPRILIDGGAGTGKTFLAMEVARRGRARGLTVLVTAWSRILTSFIRSRLPADIRVEPFDDLSPPTESERCDLLIVDEAQDVLTIDDLQILDRQLRGGLADGQWCLFYDPNNQSAVRGHFDAEAVGFLASMGSVVGHLRWNCRNTREVATQTKLLTGADLGTTSAGAGPSVEYRYFRSRDECARHLETYLNALVAADVSLADVTILSPVPWDESAASALPQKWRRQITIVDENNVGLPHHPGPRFSTIEGYKGLESRYVALIDISEYDRTPRALSLIYVGMSRARAALIILLDSRLEDAIRHAAMANLPAVLKEPVA